MALKEKCRELSETEEKFQTEICHDVMDGEIYFSYSQTHRTDTRKPEVQMRVHAEERSFTCQHCGKRFSGKQYLACHLKVHKRKP